MGVKLETNGYILYRFKRASLKTSKIDNLLLKRY